MKPDLVHQSSDLEDTIELDIGGMETSETEYLKYCARGAGDAGRGLGASHPSGLQSAIEFARSHFLVCSYGRSRDCRRLRRT